MDKYIEYCTNNIYTLFPKEYDAKIADSILEIFRKRDNIDIFNYLFMTSIIWWEFQNVVVDVLFVYCGFFKTIDFSNCG